MYYINVNVFSTNRLDSEKLHGYMLLLEKMKKSGK